MSVAVAEQFQSLYRRYRPQRFSEVRGQAHVVLGLRNAVRDERVAHAYLFSGPRGTGKTSTARILAKALNCAAPEEGEPCGVCASCVEIARGASLDVHELDAASNNGVDAMRDLVARASLATPGKWKIYIVDEVHMLSTAASNALLKTLEEPPSHVVFVLATTDPQKVLPTIRSRTQHFEFHLLESTTLTALLSDIAGDAHLDLPPDGVEAAVRRAHGSARDALSALDLVAAAGVVEDDDRYVRDLVLAIAERDTARALRTVSEAMVAGFDAARLAGELVDGLRGVFLGAVAPDLHLSEGAGAAGDASGNPILGPARCVRALEIIGSAIVDMREALDARTTFEVALVRLTNPEVDDGLGALLERIERLERRMQDLASGGGPGGGTPAHVDSTSGRAALRPPAPVEASPVQPVRSPAASPPAEPSAPSPPEARQTPLASGDAPALGAFRSSPRPAAAEPAEPAEPAAAPPTAAAPSATTPQSSSPPAGTGSAPTTPTARPTRDDLVIAWGDHVLANLRPRARATYNSGRFVSLDDGVAVFALPNAAHVEHAAPLVQEVAAAISAQVGTPISLRLVTDSSAGDDATAARGEDPPPASSPASDRPRPSAPPSRAQVEPPPADPDDEMADLEDLQPGEAVGPHDSVSWAEGRLLEVFPGAEEVP